MYVWGMKNLETLNQIIKRIFNFKLEKSWNIEPNETKSQYLICSYLWCDTWEYFNFFRIERATWQNLIFSYMRSLLLYIQVNSQTMSLRERERERERDAFCQSKDEIEKKERQLKYLDVAWGQGSGMVRTGAAAYCKLSSRAPITVTHMEFGLCTYTCSLESWHWNWQMVNSL